jgi:indolepyruvate decarboxylase
LTSTVIQHVLERLKAIGIVDIFGVPGDYAFPVNDAICNDPALRWIGCTNELNASYAADGYARIKGTAALCTTYGVGELSAINGIAGAYAEHLPIFHLVGMPGRATQTSRAIMHHTLGNGEYDLFRRMTEPVVCASAVMTPQNVAYETERLIAEALFHRRPVYMAFPADYADLPVLGSAQPIPAPASNNEALAAATAAIGAALDQAQTACVLPGTLIARSGLQTEMQAVIEKSGLPFATMFMDKSVLDEQHPVFVGMYDGAIMSEEVRAFVESRDVVLAIGTLASDFNTGAFTSRLDPAKTIGIGHHHAHVGGRTYANVELGDVLKALAKKLTRRNWPTIPVPSLGGRRQRRGPDHGGGALSALGRVPEATRHRHWRDAYRVDGARLRADAEGRDLPQSDAVGFDRLGDTGRGRSRRRRARSPRRAGDWRGLAPVDRSGSRTVRPTRPEAADLRAQQQRLSD